MTKKQFRIRLIIWVAVIAVLLTAILLLPTKPRSETIRITMKDAVLHETNKINLFGILEVNPAVISAYTVTGIILVFALVCRIFAVPKFKDVPGKLQLLLEEAVGLFDNLAKSNSPHSNKLLGVYVFSAGAYIFIGTLFELLGIQAITTEGNAITLSAPLSDINGAIGMGVMSYLFIMIGGITSNGMKGLGNTLKDFSLPISMSFRLFGALLSGLLVTELVYYYVNLSFVLPVIVGVLFTILHAIIQTYVLTMLTALFYGEVTEKKEKKKKAKA